MFRSIKYLADKKDIELIAPANGHVFTLKELQQHVGGYIYIYNYCEFLSLIINEQGAESGQAFNSQATRIVSMMGIDRKVYGNSIKCRNEHLYGIVSENKWQNDTNF